MFIIRELIYISGPMLSQGHPYKNIRIAAQMADYAYSKGWAPITPHLDAVAQMITGNLDLQRYLQTDFSQIAQCKALLLSDSYTKEFGPDGNKSGTAQELDLAEILGIPIYTIDTLPESKGAYVIDPSDVVEYKNGDVVPEDLWGTRRYDE